MPEVHICEVGPRDGLQNAKHMMPTAAKKAWISALAAAGLKEIEVGSFVPPKLIPAMADTGEIVAHARTIPGLTVVALAPNLKGYQRAVEAGAHKVTFPVSASRAHSESNVRMTPDQMVPEVRKCAGLDRRAAGRASLPAPRAHLVRRHAHVGLAVRAAGRDRKSDLVRSCLDGALISLQVGRQGHHSQARNRPCVGDDLAGIRHRRNELGRHEGADLDLL